MKLTPNQREFMKSITPDDAEDIMAGFECYPEERRTALSLRDRGLVEFPEEEPDAGELFTARLTASGRAAVGMRCPCCGAAPSAWSPKHAYGSRSVQAKEAARDE